MKDSHNPGKGTSATPNVSPDKSTKPKVVDDQDAAAIAGETVAQVGAATNEPVPQTPKEAKGPSTGRSAFLVGAGILISRIVGLVRQRIFSHYFGISAEGDAFNAAFRIPNFLQNVFGEGALSASFIPVYARLLAQNDEKEAAKVANAIFGLLALVTAVIVVLGVAATPYIVTALAAGFDSERRELTIKLVRILFPGAGLMVMSAWCLGVLNSHHRFLVSYAAPVVWNAAMITTLVLFGAGRPLPQLARILAWGSVIGSGLMFVVQLPIVVRLAPDLRFALDTAS